MDLDVNAATASTSFNTHFPLPYRILLLITLGVWFWGFNAHLFHYMGIDVGVMVRYPRREGDMLLHYSVYQVAAFLTAIYTINIATFWKLTNNDEKLVKEWDVLPLGCFAFMLGILFFPGSRFHGRGRGRVVRMLRRILIGSIDRDLRFGDLLLSDALISYSKVLADVWITGCMLFSSGMSTTSRPDRSCGGAYFVPFAMAFPSFIRLRQCIIECFRTPKSAAKERQAHLLNSLKYASAFPVIILSAAQHEYDPHEPHWLSKEAISRLWILFIVINSFYAFYWDVARDWDLTLFNRKQRSNPEHPFGLRQILLFRPHYLYYLAIMVDFCIRCAWSFKLSPHLGHLQELEVGIFVMEILEVFRRWMWIFLRIEKEYVSRETVMGGINLAALEECGDDGRPEGLVERKEKIEM